MSEQNIQYEKTLQKGINLLKNNPNAIIDIIQVANRLSYLRGRLFEQSHPTKQTVQTESGDALSKDLKRSGGSTEVKTDDSNSYKCGHKTSGMIVMDDNELSMSTYIQWAEEENNLETKQECFDCFLKKLK